MFYNAIKQIYPDIPDGDFELQDDGSGPQIIRWDYPNPQPTQSELEAAWTEYQAGAVDRAKAAAVVEVKQQAAAEEESLDDVISGEVRVIMLNTEIVRYYEDGRPANPSANVYVIANAMATRRGIALREMLEILFAKWRDMQMTIAAITTELDRLIEGIGVAGSVAEVEAVVESAVWP